MTETTLDAFLGGALHLIQPGSGYRAGIDAVLLAATCEARPGEQIADCGAGVGTVGLCAVARLGDVQCTLIERVPAMAALARDNVRRNGMADRVTVVEADLTAALTRTDAVARLIGNCDHVLANPPFHGKGSRSPDPLKDAAHAMPPAGLEAWSRAMTALLRPGGTATLIHPTEALPAILTAWEGRFGAIDIVPIHTRNDAPALRILVRGRKGSRAPLRQLPMLVLHEESGHGYRPDIDRVLRGPHPLTCFG